RPTGGGSSPRLRSAAVDKRERAERRLRAALAPTAGEEAHRRADPAGEDEAGGEGAPRCDREVGAELRVHVRRLAESVPEVLDGGGERLALHLELALDLLRVATVGAGHQDLIASVVRFASTIASSGTGGVAARMFRIPSQTSSAAIATRTSPTISSASQRSSTIASATAAVASRNPTA